jgi:Ca2+-binding RTX toxin-like protein
MDGGKGADEQFGGEGFDIATYATSAQGVEVHLDTGNASGGDATGDHLYSIEGVIGSKKTDYLYGGIEANSLVGEAGNDWLYAGSGSDEVDGGKGNDLVQGDGRGHEMKGGKGADQFTYVSESDSGALASLRDQILDFKHSEGDRINLNALDANTGAGGNQNFAFVGSDDFSGAGQVRFEQVQGWTYVQVNTDADASVETEIALKGSINLVTQDFVL